MALCYVSRYLSRYVKQQNRVISESLTSCERCLSHCTLTVGEILYESVCRHMYVDVYGRSSFTGRGTIKDNSLFEVDNKMSVDSGFTDLVLILLKRQNDCKLILQTFRLVFSSVHFKMFVKYL